MAQQRTTKKADTIPADEQTPPAPPTDETATAGHEPVVEPTLAPADIAPADEQAADTASVEAEMQALLARLAELEAAQPPAVAEDLGPLVTVHQPCRVCYPGGWPVPEPGAEAGCHHGLTIRHGKTAQIPHAVAQECRLL